MKRPTNRQLFLMKTQGVTLEELKDIDHYLDDLADYSARMRAIEPYLNGDNISTGLEKCLLLARKHIGASVGIMVDVIDLWLRNEKDTDKTIADLNLFD